MERGSEPRSRWVERQARDLLALIDDFEQFAGQLPRVPLTGKLIIEEDDLFGFLDQLRKLVPDEIRRAAALVEDRERLLADARARAEAVVEEARRQAQRLVDESEVLRRAAEEAEQMLGRARQSGRQLKAEADAYADEVLGRLEAFLQRALEQVRDGRAQVRAGEAAAAGDADGVAEAPRQRRT